MTPKVVKNNTEGRSLASWTELATASAREEPDDSIEVSEIVKPVDPEKRSKRKGRGPSAINTGIINAFLEMERSGKGGECEIDVALLRRKTGKPKLKTESVRQALYNNLKNMTDDDGRPLWETIGLSYDKSTDLLTMYRRKPKK